ncbi:MAG: 4-alpha-glucanotransferase [Gemmatimonadetes bacterium]|nr:4-alpha-glucanotransferase [Gemmatimonadota bacterium]
MSTTHLERLATRVGILPDYFDQSGTKHRTTDETRRALLAALGFDATTEEDAEDALARLDAEASRELMPPVRVIEIGNLTHERFDVRTPRSRARGPWRLDIETETGRQYRADGAWQGDALLELALPPDLPIGYHTVRLCLNDVSQEWIDEQTLIVVPPRCVSPEEIIGPGGAFGLIANLYTLRSDSNWGVGDFSDLATLGEWGGSAGADFAGVNPLHALLNRGNDISPYSPVSRLFRNPLYVDVARVPELDQAPEVRERIMSPELQAQLASLRESAEVKYEQVMGVKGIALDALHRVFWEGVRGSGNARDRAYAEYVAANEPALTRFATWMAIAEDQMRHPGNTHGCDWRDWPVGLRTPDSPAVRRFAETHETRVDFHRWLQFEADRQLGEAADRARSAGMRIGLYQDLAIGTSPAGADAWSLPTLFARGASVGAPPDPLATNGQNWGLPPMNPRVLQRNRYRYFIDLVRSGFRHAGALRIDHVMGLFRLFWIPEGRPGSEGAYVEYPSNDLLGIIALESVRHNALVVGEDLGTVPDYVPPALAKWGVLSSKVLYFERDWNSGGAFKPADSYPRLALATANTHDLATLTGFWEGRDIDVRRSVGLIESDEDARRAHDERNTDRVALLRALSVEKIIPENSAPQTPAVLRAAVHAFLCRTPSQLVGLSVDDLAGEVESVNVPGVGPDKYPSWTRKMRVSLEVLAASTDALVALRCDGRMRSSTEA